MNIFDSLFRTELTVTRPPNQELVKGRWVDIGIPTTLTIKASVQGLNADVAQTLPQGYNTIGTRVLYTSTELRTASVGNHQPDVVTIDGLKFQVKEVTKRANIKRYCTNHYQVIVVQQNIDN